MLLSLGQAALAALGGGASAGNAGALGAGGGRAFYGGPRARGGMVRAGVSYRVGEGGSEEIFIPDMAGRIEPASNMRVGMPAAVGAGGGVKVIFNLINNTGEPANIRERTDADGTQRIDAIVGRAAASDVRNGGPLGSAIGQTFGLQRRGINRG